MRDELVAVFAGPDEAHRALDALREQGIGGVRVASPAPFPVVHMTGQPGPWRALGWIALVGGLTGLGSAIALQVITSVHLGLVVGGKPIVAWTSFGVIMFELTMLFAGCFNLAAFALLSAIARRRVARAARDQVTCDRIALVVPLAGVEDEIRKAIRDSITAAALEVVP